MSADDRALYAVTLIRNDDARMNCVLLRRRKGLLVLNQRHNLCERFGRRLWDCDSVPYLSRYNRGDKTIQHTYAGMGCDVTRGSGFAVILLLAGIV